MQMAQTTPDGSELYHKFWDLKAPTHDRALSMQESLAPGNQRYGSAGDPLGSQRAMIQNSMLHQLGRRAQSKLGDSWIDEVDPTISYGANLRNLLGKGAGKLESEIEHERDKILADADQMALDHAEKTLRENAEAIRSGEKSDLAEDIAAEFSREFVELVLEEEKEQAATDPEPLPEPETTEEPEPEPVETPDPAPETTEKPASPAVQTRDYSGIVGFLRLSVDLVRIPFKAGYESSKPQGENT